MWADNQKDVHSSHRQEQKLEHKNPTKILQQTTELVY